MYVFPWLCSHVLPIKDCINLTYAASSHFVSHFFNTQASQP
jgi:hypothetical protein